MKESINNPDMMGVTGPCGHSSPFDDAFVRRDEFRCPTCFMVWRIEVGKPTVLRSGFVMPGNRRVVIEPKTEMRLGA